MLDVSLLLLQQRAPANCCSRVSCSSDTTQLASHVPNAGPDTSSTHIQRQEHQQRMHINEPSRPQHDSTNRKLLVYVSQVCLQPLMFQPEEETEPTFSPRAVSESDNTPAHNARASVNMVFLSLFPCVARGSCCQLRSCMRLQVSAVLLLQMLSWSATNTS